MNEEYLLHVGALRVFADFSQPSCEKFAIAHDNMHPKFGLLRKKYPILETAGQSSDFEKALRLMAWVHQNVRHCGGGGEVDLAKDSLAILNYVFGKGRRPGVFCYHIAIVFTECCLAVGLTARTIHCKPFSPNDLDTHVVSMVYVSEMDKWVLFDPNNNAYFTDKQGLPLSPLEVRERLGREDIQVIGNPQEEPDWYVQYMAKNLFYIKFWARNTFGTDLVEDQKI